MIGTTVRKFKCACGLDVSVSLCEHFAIADAEHSASVAQLEAEVARLEALIVSTVEAATGIDADLHAEYDRIKAKP